jgi:hypothetical protein
VLPHVTTHQSMSWASYLCVLACVEVRRIILVILNS